MVILSTNFLIGGPRISAAIIAIGKLTVQAFKNLLIYGVIGGINCKIFSWSISFTLSIAAVY